MLGSFRKKDFLKKLMRNFNFNIFRKLPVGINPFNEITEIFGKNTLNVIFDVGANKGRYAQIVRDYFSTAEIYCFEPFEKTYEELKSNVIHSNIKTFNFGLGDIDESIQVEYDKTSKKSYSNSLIHRNEIVVKSKELVEIKTLDLFCQQHEINQIDFLKIDTEGYDLKVLEGSINMLENLQIKFIQVEASMSNLNNRHVNYLDFVNYLDNYGFQIFGIYNQAIDKKKFLRRADIVFINKCLIG